jgi:hypothetical protein
MSVLDQLRTLEQQVQQRLRELRPLIAEYRDLEKVAERLGLKRDQPEPADAAAAKPAPRAASKPTRPRSQTRKAAATKSRASTRAATARASQRTAKATPKATAARRGTAAGARGGKPSARRRTAAAPGQRQQDVLRLVRERPGITVAELATELSVDATGLYGVVRRLQSKGQIRKEGTRLQPVEDTTPTTDASATSSSAPGSASPAASPEPRPDNLQAPARES